MFTTLGSYFLPKKIEQDTEELWLSAPGRRSRNQGSQGTPNPPCQDQVPLISGFRGSRRVIGVQQTTMCNPSISGSEGCRNCNVPDLAVTRTSRTPKERPFPLHSFLNLFIPASSRDDYSYFPDSTTPGRGGMRLPRKKPVGVNSIRPTYYPVPSQPRCAAG